ncbi:SDR family oxidoreductase [Streptomyces albus]|uniref:SDR family NAD(P)-dependent oxidoreductase n=1 Tax=Streptomyces TaxID=1883 RepID=UPI0005A6D6AA|nr:MULTISPECIES: SDR family oxidoreductase [Streptomyces]KPC93718.1 short-chain dehydrogenase [Streptomyces sp. NRRL F-6602]QID35820.1 SDR family oxidoreductase [Streptomyces albus]
MSAPGGSPADVVPAAPLAGKRVLLTGGTRGIGRATALALARAGARLVVAHRTEHDGVRTLTGELAGHGPDHRLVRADVTRADDAARLAAVCEEHLGGLDVLVNNVGVDGHSKLADLAEDEWHRLLDANVTSAYLVTRAVLGLLADGASIVNVGASVALRGRPFGTHYSASKAALIGFGRALCKEVGERGIRVNTVAPGVTADDEPGAGPAPPVAERLAALTALGRLGTPADVAGAVLYLAGDTSRYVTGATITVDGGI